MKKLKTFVTMLAAVAAIILLPGISTLKASAAEPTIYCIDYEPEDGWYVQSVTDPNGNDDESWKSMQYFYNNVQCGDAVVVTCSYDDAPQLDLGSTRLGNVTILPSGCFIMIKSAGIADFYALASTVCSMSAPIINAYLYDPVVVNFNSNVGDILLTVDGWEGSSSSMACAGTVDSMRVYFSNGNTSYTLYNFKKDTFYFEDGSIATSGENFSFVPGVTAFQFVPDNRQITTLKDLFDEHYYADKYPDLKAVFGYNREALWAHYLNNGINEARDMNGMFNVTLYRNQYQDLNQAFGNNWEAYLTHYLTLGAMEGRDSGTGFRAKSYANWYPELTATYGNNLMGLWQHYNRIGVEWSRQP